MKVNMTDSIELKIGLDTITSYRRLSYTAWHAIAEFVDNSTQSYFDNKNALDEVFRSNGETGLEVSVVYDRSAPGGLLRITDNAMGMSLEELRRAMHVAMRPPSPVGRSRYGMGLKTSACWIGNQWTVRTKKLGETSEYAVTVDVDRVANGDPALPFETRSGLDPSKHYTLLEITQHIRSFKGRRLGKIREYLRSMYREDFRTGQLRLLWNHENLVWGDPKILIGRDGNPLRKDFQFEVDGKRVSGWVGILERGSRADAGFSIIHSGRVIKGWPDSWRPSSLYGQIQGSNDLVNQRLVGEIHLDDFEISHTKDDILWLGSQEDDVEDKLLDHCGDYKEYAKTYRKTQDDERGPSNIEVEVAVDELMQELQSPEMVDRIELSVVPDAQIVQEAKKKIVEDVTRRSQETLRASVGSLSIRIYLASELSTNDPYVTPEPRGNGEVIVIVNTSHPHWGQLKGSEGVINYLRHCVYDAIAEWQAFKKASSLDPDTIKLLKDQLLRVSFEIERHSTLRN